jgi:hypothetical protein
MMASLKFRAKQRILSSEMIGEFPSVHLLEIGGGLKIREIKSIVE